MTQKEYQEFTRDYQKPYQEDSNSINSKDFIIGALVGGMVGAATALFMAPKSGKDLRNDLNVQAKNLSEKTEKIRQVAMEKGGSLAETAKEKTNVVTDMVTNKSADLMTKVKSMKPNSGESDSTLSNDGSVSDYSTSKAPTTDFTAADRDISTADATSSSSTVPGKNAAQLKLDETRKAFEETENQYNK
ncbi:YtxH domain-containing protein [Peribacillus cavernae]|uniref:YtxH domain-containing protein n=1 Tax=Peribacillus cavernae TaxID=1674310 RepID=A0A3S0VPC7_9BACI|nr:YtxH domain-containing protein [Peribacillus cavernae]MDQ0220324.1 gas vesicle protein [Peribacillus cavernae]RUQ31979.1 YtxH domain-containing protein [Peribacillus cavernae]